MDVEKPEAEDYYSLGAAYLRDHKMTSSYQALQKAMTLDPKSEAALNAQELIDSMRTESREGFAVEAD